MPRLYEGESVEIYSPRHNSTRTAHVEPASEEDVAAIERGKLADELLNSGGWKLLKATVDGEVEALTAQLIDEIDPAVIGRLQAAIKVYKNIEGFVNRYVLQGQVAMENRELTSEDGD